MLSFRPSINPYFDFLADQEINYLINKTMGDLMQAEQDATIDTDVSKISIVGSRLASTPGLAGQMFAVLAREGINIDCISSSEMKIACVISEDHIDRAVQSVHNEFFPTNEVGE